MLQSIFYAYALEQQARLAGGGLKFAHHTTAENAFKILTSQTLWLRNATIMNDHSEIAHGMGVVAEIIDSAKGRQFWIESIRELGQKLCSNFMTTA